LSAFSFIIYPVPTAEQQIQNRCFGGNVVYPFNGGFEITIKAAVFFFKIE
jgi:hypothetical protein